ncbi:helix-turn-helix domain-containing protein [Desemzia sp. C1]|uniref:BglG family transcription antiterminator n=1 Tax=Desemzia sp. C1 TaxID=2892016 RepID=UPI001E527FE5|nr:PRD domain-containing protein [Desemzia sp. C1]MCI3028782.1 helix-turn-helix domain-containing protein [Desemzia sp. C1]
MSECIYLDSLLNLLLNEKELPKQDVLKRFRINSAQLEKSLKEIATIYSGVLEIDQTTDSISLKVLNEKYLYNILRMSGEQDLNDPEYRVAYILYRLIDGNDYININDLSEEMSVSRSTVNNDIKRAKILLEPYNAQIVGVPNRGISISCSEFNLRLILIHFLYDRLGSTYIVNKEVQAAVKQLGKSYKLDHATRHLLYKTIIITIERVRQEIHLQEDIPMYKNYTENATSFLNLIESLEINYQLMFSKIDIEFLSFPINTLNSSRVIGSENNYNESKVKEIVHQMLGTVKQNLMIKIDEEIFFDKVKNHLLFLINRLTFHLPNNEIASNQVKTRFPLAYELARLSLNDLEEHYHLKATNTDISYLAIYYALVLSENNQKNIDDNLVKQIAVVTNRGQGAIEFIKKQIRETVGADVIIEHFTTEDISFDALRNFNIIFTTEAFSTAADIPIIEIEPFVNSHDLDKKLRDIEPYMFIDKEKMEKEVEFYVYDLDESINYIENTKKMIRKIYRSTQEAEEINNTFLKKNEISPMLYENGVAFPHIVDTRTQKITLAMGKASTMNKTLNLVFFLVVPEQLNDWQENILTKIYEKIFTVISNKKKISNFQQVTSINKYVSLLLEEDEWL